jgi:zeta-carotene desaturase
VLEKRPVLGGRAYSYTDQTTGDVIDNGQHAMMGCYTEMFRFLDRIGATDKLAIQPGLRVDMLDPVAERASSAVRRCRTRSTWVPACSAIAS